MQNQYVSAAEVQARATLASAAARCHRSKSPDAATSAVRAMWAQHDEELTRRQIFKLSEALGRLPEAEGDQRSALRWLVVDGTLSSRQLRGDRRYSVNVGGV